MRDGMHRPLNGMPEAVNRKRPRTQWSQRRASAGFTYLAVLFLLALAGITATATAIVWRIEQQRELEAELLFAGAEFARAIESYRAVAPNAPQPWPRSLEDLVRDPRTPGVRRHLRKVYRDPIRRSTEWGLIRTPEGGIVGVHSLSMRKPIRTVPAAGLTLREPGSYAGWLFAARGAPAIVRDARSGLWMASGPVVAATAAAGAEATATPPTNPAGAGAGATPAAPGATVSTVAPVAPVAPGATTKPDVPAKPRANCSVIARNDRSACAAVTQRFGSTDGDLCLASAIKREAQCTAGEDVTTMLAVRYF